MAMLGLESQLASIGGEHISSLLKQLPPSPDPRCAIGTPAEHVLATAQSCAFLARICTANLSPSTPGTHEMFYIVHIFSHIFEIVKTY